MSDSLGPDVDELFRGRLESQGSRVNIPKLYRSDK